MPFIELAAQRRPPTPPAGMKPPENAADWFRIENSTEDPDATDVLIYSSIGGWFGMYADEFIEALGQVTTAKVNLRLNSPGGSVFEGIAIANAIRSHPAAVTVYVDSLAASIASVIALAGDRTVMMPQSQFMIHNASGAEYGQASDLRKMADLLDKQSLNIAQAYASHTGRPLAEWQELMEAETWFTAEEAVKMGLADEIVPMRPAKGETSDAGKSDVMNRTWDLSMYRYAGRDNAPAPKQVTVHAELDTGADPTRKTVRPVTNETTDDEPVTDTIANMTRDDLVALIRDVVTTAMAPVEKGNDPAPSSPAEPPSPDPADAFPPPEEEEEEAPETEDANSEEDEESDPEDAKKKKKLPPFLQPDEDEEEEEDDPKDAWSGLVARLTAPSPSADDVFTSLKEAW